jgi:hypothetical protein
MKNLKPFPRPLAWFFVVVASLMIALALFNLIFNTRLVGSWLPLIVVMPICLVAGIRSLRALSSAER